MADTSGILAAVPQGVQAPPNPLQTLGTIQDITNAQTLNKLYQQDILNKQQELQNLQLTNQTGQFNLMNAQQSRARALLFGLSNRSDDELKGGGALTDVINRETQTGFLQPKAASDLQQQVDEITKNGGAQNGALYRPLMDRLYSVNMPTDQAVEFLRGKTVQTTLPGGMSQAVVVPGLGAAPGTPTRSIGTPYGGGVEPGSGADLMDVQLPDGTHMQMTRSQLATANLPAGARATPVAATSSPAAAGGTTTGTSGTATGTGGAGASVAPPLGTPLPNADQIKLANASRAQALTDMGNLTSRNWNDMQGSLNTIRNLSPSVDSGKGTDFANTAKQILVNTLPNVATSLGIDPNKSMDQQDLWKALSRAAAASGNRSDADLFQKVSSNPNQEMSPVAMQRAAGYVLALNNQEAVLTREAAAESTNQPLDLTTHYAAKRLAVQDQTDPNAFRVPYMTDDELSAYRKTLTTPGAVARFNRTLKLMKQYLPPAGGLPATAPAQ